MQVGYFSQNTPEDETAATLGPALEDRAFESVWFGEHPHIPCSSAQLYPGAERMPDVYRRMLDPFLSLMAMAGATTDLKLGTAVVLPLEHDVFDLAKRVSTLDLLSGGRLMFGVGAGWNEHELANCRSIGWSRRYEALSECVGALKTLWCDAEAAFHGRFFDFEPVWSEPKPRQRPHPPIMCGMAGKLGTRSVVAWADGWMPLDVGLGNVEKKLRLFRDAAALSGRTDVPVTIVAWGDPTFDTLLRYRDLGVERVIVGVARAGLDDPSTTLPFLDSSAALIDRLR